MTRHGKEERNVKKAIKCYKFKIFSLTLSAVIDTFYKKQLQTEDYEK